MEEYFVIVYEKDTIKPKVQEIVHFFSADSLWPWLQEHREDKIAVYKAPCVLDFS